MTGPAVICAPMRMEARALRSGLGGRAAGSVVRIGVGRWRADHVARSGPVLGAAAIAVSGLCGALDRRLRPGDVVVADEVRTENGTSQPCSSAALVAARLEAAGLRTWLGPILCVDHVVTGAEREALAGSGALAVEMESAWLLSPDRPGVVVRVVADTVGAPLLRPATLGRLRTALGALPMVVPVLADWMAALGHRRVLLAEPRSFCAGVERAIQIVELALEQRGSPVYVRKQIVHNKHVVAGLQQRGAIFVEDLDAVPAGSTVVFSAHGVSPAVRSHARSRDLDVIDATCPLVAKVHAEVRRFADRGDTVIFIGHGGHEETEGTMGERPDRTVLVECLADARTVAVADPDKVTYLVQTTLSADEVAEIVDALRLRFPALRAPSSDDICYATTNRQDALRAVAADADLVLVVGSPNSSNSLRLVETARRLGRPAHLIDDARAIDLRWLAGVDTVAVTAGASAPQVLVDDVIRALAGLGTVEVSNRSLVAEDVHFTLPKEVRPA